MKRLLFVLLIVLFLAACGGQTAEPVTSPEPVEPIATPAPIEDEAEPLRIIATIFPQYDFIRQIAGDRVELSMLIAPGAESHAFEPAPRDMIDLYEADMLVYVGGHGDT